MARRVTLSSESEKREHILPVRSVSSLGCSSPLSPSLPLSLAFLLSPPLFSSSSAPLSCGGERERERERESHNDLERDPAAAAIVCAGCTPDSLNQLLQKAGVGRRGLHVPESGRGGGGGGENVFTGTHAHMHSHTNTQAHT